MEVTVSIPDELVPPGEIPADLSRHVLEAYAIENYRQEKISLGRLAEILDLSIDRANAFLKEHNVPNPYDLEDMERDLRTLDLLFSK